MTAAPAAAPRRLGDERLAGTGRLARFALRRDRVRLPVWVLGISVTVVLTAASFSGLYPDAAARQARAILMGNPAAVAFGGPEIGIADYTFGAMLTNEMLGLVSVVVALMSILTVVRHTRADEEEGRTELVLAGAVGRRAPLAAALAVAVLADLAVAVVTAVGLGAAGVESIDMAGSWLFGAGLAGTGIVFAGAAAVTAQLTEHARTATAWAGLALGVAYAVRAVGDIASDAVAWLSPIAWAQRTYAYVDDRWWPLLLSLATAALLMLAAFVLADRRDHGVGLRQTRAGPATGSPALASPLGLAGRLQRGGLVGWALSFLGFGLVYGLLFGEVEGFAEDLGTVQSVLRGMGTDDLFAAYLALLATLFAMMATVFAVIAVRRAQAEERVGHADVVLATPVTRARWLGAHTVVAAAGSAGVLLAGSLGLGVSGSLSVDDWSILGDVLLASLVQVIPMLAVVALAVALYGLAPRATGLVWVVLGYGLLAGMLGGLLGLPQWAMDLSPFSLVPLLPAEDFAPWPVVAMLLVAAALLTIGLWAFHRRDVATEI